MIMMSPFAVGEVPFENVYLHGMVLDKFGKKMSKSKGNGIDPIDMIKLFGTDAVRLSLLIGSTPGNDTRISEEKIGSFRNFVTKLWNIYRYAAGTDDNFKLVEKIGKKDIKTLSDKWIVSRLNILIKEVTQELNDYKFSLAGEKLQNFTWNELADWYVESNKIEKNKNVLGYILRNVLLLWHPFMPFVTEKIWSDTNATNGHTNDTNKDTNKKKMLMVEKWPVADKKLVDKKAEKEFQNLQEIITKVRNLRSNYHIEPGKIITAYGKNIKNTEIIGRLARVKFDGQSAKGIAVSAGKIKISLDISGMVDMEKEKVRLKKEIQNLETLAIKTEGLLKNKKFLESAPKVIVAQNKVKLVEYENRIKIQRELLKNLG